MESDSRFSVEVAVEEAAWRTVVANPSRHCREVVVFVLKSLQADGVCAESDRSVPHEPGSVLEVSIVLTDDATVRTFNKTWRGIDAPTNVLSFPSTPTPAVAAPSPLCLLGDVMLACGTVQREAEAQGKYASDHMTHLLVHGVLHLLGFDHEAEDEAQRMEQLETRLLARLGVSDPYMEFTL